MVSLSTRKYLSGSTWLTATVGIVSMASVAVSEFVQLSQEQGAGYSVDAFDLAALGGDPLFPLESDLGLLDGDDGAEPLADPSSIPSSGNSLEEAPAIADSDDGSVVAFLMPVLYPQANAETAAPADIAELTRVHRTGSPVELETDVQEVAPTADLSLASAEVAESRENALKLSKGEKAVVQRRLILAGYDPLGVDGIFGEGTRAAITDLQEREGLAVTGFLNTESLTKLEGMTQDGYTAWRAARVRATKLAKAVEVPRQRPNVEDDQPAGSCARDARGRIVENQSFSCDLAGFGEKMVAPRRYRDGGDEAHLAELFGARDR